jgi:DNA-binding NarL/FixJ family response regulator
MYQDEKFIRHLMDNGADGYLLKDAEPEQILSSIQGLLQ